MAPTVLADRANDVREVALADGQNARCRLPGEGFAELLRANGSLPLYTPDRRCQGVASRDLTPQGGHGHKTHQLRARPAHDDVPRERV